MLILKSFLFGLLLVIAFVLGNFLLWKKAKAKGFVSDIIFDLSLESLVGGLVAGRIVYIATHWQLFQIDIFRWIHLVRYPGFSGKSVIIGYLLTLWYLSKKKKVDYWLFADCLVVPFLYALLLGQLGCLINGCVVGTVTTLPWGKIALGFLGNRHPLGLYAIIGTLLLMFFVKKAEVFCPKILSSLRQTKNREVKEGGLIFLFGLMIFALVDFVLELFKQNALYLGNVNLEILVDAILFLGSLVLLLIRFGKTNLSKNI